MVYEPKLVWLIQGNQDDRRAVLDIQDILDDLGVRWIEVEIDFRSPALPAIEGIEIDDIVICHGPSFIPRIDHVKPNWKVGCIFDPASFRWSEFQKHWGSSMLSTDGTVKTVQNLRDHPPQEAIFVRPDADSKKFDGGIKSPIELNEVLAGLPPELCVVMATPLEIEAEYRVFMIASEIVAASQYRQAGVASFDGFIPNAVIDLALHADEQWRPKDAYVLDIAKSGQRYGIVEANCITAARYYNGNTRAIVTGLCRFCSSSSTADP